MILARVSGNVVASVKNGKLAGQKLLLVQPLDPEGETCGEPLLAIDGVGAGPGETVLVVLEGRAAGAVLGDAEGPVDAAVVAIVDRVDRTAQAREPG